MCVLSSPACAPTTCAYECLTNSIDLLVLEQTLEAHLSIAQPFVGSQLAFRIAGALTQVRHLQHTKPHISRATLCPRSGWSAPLSTISSAGRYQQNAGTHVSILRY